MAYTMRQIFFLQCLVVSLASAECYYPNGIDTNKASNVTTYAPCGDLRSHSMCCRTLEFQGGDTCREDGLCTNGEKLWRESCTDPLWESNACVKLCVSGNAQIYPGEIKKNFSATHVLITTCPDGSLCCGDKRTAAAQYCCRNGQGVWLVNGTIHATNPNSTSSANPVESTFTATDLPSKSSSTTLATTQPAKAKVNGGVIVGAVLGGVGCLIVLAGITWFRLYGRKQAEHRSDSAKIEDAMKLRLDDSMKFELNDSMKSELDDSMKLELENSAVSELSGDSTRFTTNHAAVHHRNPVVEVGDTCIDELSSAYRIPSCHYSSSMW